MPLEASHVNAITPVRPPSGGAAPTIAFSAEVENIWQIFTIDPDGSGLQRLTKGRTHSLMPAWSPDRQRIAFIRQGRAGGFTLHTMSAGGKGARQITSAEYAALYPSWSPDGNTIVFAGFEPGQRSEIYTVPADGSAAPTRLTTDSLYDVQPVFSPDGSKIAMMRYGTTSVPNIFLMDPDGQNITQFTFCTMGCQSPMWSPDGSKLAFQRQDSLFVATLGAGNPVGVAAGLTGSARASWSPDGTELVFVAKAPGTFMPDLFAVPAAGGQPRRLTSSSLEERTPSWAQ
ncbi:MAG TPA: hypothetical protein VK922_00785 [Gemmatimonadaceae bacterium]|nr:hypothetical protein [Gemmatimonadaceae bacterium]